MSSVSSFCKYEVTEFQLHTVVFSQSELTENEAHVVRTVLFNEYARKRASTSLLDGTSHFFLGSLSIIFVIGPSLT